MYSFPQFKRLPAEMQIEQLNRSGVPLDLAFCIKNTEAVLFAYNNFYVELVVERVTDEILSIKAFKGVRKLEPYLQQVDISGITALLSCGL